MDKTSTLFLRKSNMSDTMSGYNGSQLGSARGIESPVHSDRNISEKNITGGMSGRNSRVELIPQGPAFIGVVPVSESRQHTKTNFSNIEREDGEQQKQQKNLKQQASMKSLRNMKSKDKSLRSNKYSTDNLNNTSPIGSHKILPSIRSNKRLSPVHSPRQNQKISLKAKSIIDSSGANVNNINNGSMDPSVAADSSTALVKQIAQSSARQGIQSEQQGNNYLPPVPLQTSVEEEENKITSKQQNKIPQKDQAQQLKNGYDTVDQNIISEVQLQKAHGQNAMIDHHNQSIDNEQNNTSTEFPGVLAFPRGAGQGASKSPRNLSNKKSSIRSSQKNKTINTSTLNKQKSKKQLNASQSSSVIGQKNIKEKKNKKKKGVERSSPRHLFEPDAMTVPVIDNQRSEDQNFRNEIDDGDLGEINQDKLPGISEQRVLPKVESSKKGIKIKNKPPNLNKSYVSDAPLGQQGQGSEQPSLEKHINQIENDERSELHQKASKPGKNQVKDFFRQPSGGIQQGSKNKSLKTIIKPKLPENSYDSSEKIQQHPNESEDQNFQKGIKDQIANDDQDVIIVDDEGRLNLDPSKIIKTSPPKQDSFSIDIYDDNNKEPVNSNQIATNGPIPTSQDQDFIPKVTPSQPPSQYINNDPKQKKDAQSPSKNQSNLRLNKYNHEQKYDNLLPGDILDFQNKGQKASPPDNFQIPKYPQGNTVDNPLAASSINKKIEQLPPADDFSPNISPYKSNRNQSPLRDNQVFQNKSKIIEHSERSASSFVNPEIDITPADFADRNKWRHSRVKNGPSRSQQIPQKRIGGNQFGIQPINNINNYNSPPTQMANQGGMMTPILYQRAGLNNNIPFSARPQFGASSVSPVFQTAGALSLEDPQNFNGFYRKQREKDVAGVVGGFEPIEPLKDSVSPMMPQMPFLTNVDGRNSTQNGRFQNEFYPKSNHTQDQSFQQMYSNDPLSARNQAIPLNNGLPLQSNGFSPHYNFGFQQAIPQNVYPIGNKMQPPQHKSQAPKTGKDFYNNHNDLLRRAYKNPTQFQKQVLEGHKPNPILHPAVDIGYNFEEEKYEIQRSDRKKQKKKSKANLREQSEKAISVAPPGGMRNILNERLKGLQNAYLPKPMGVKKKSKANLKGIETPRLALNKNQLGPHISPPQGQPPMSRMSPIPPNHNNYAFSPRK